VLWIEWVVGLVLLFFGRSLFWVFVALAGFLLGVRLSEVALADETAWVGLLAAIGAGVVGALVALLAQRVGFALAGLFAGGNLTVSALPFFHVGGSSMTWIAVGSALGALIAILVMDWALIFLSCLVGAGAVVRGLGVGPGVAAALYAALVAVGVLFQGRRLAPAPPPAKT
jgi:hypothetical protein